MLEHRWGKRESIGVEVGLHRVGRQPLRGRSLNISTSGIFVATFGQDLTLHAQVELVLVFSDSSVTRIKRLEAMVVRLADNGVGLAFADPSTREVQQLLALCRGHNQATRVAAYCAGGPIEPALVERNRALIPVLPRRSARGHS